MVCGETYPNSTAVSMVMPQYRADEYCVKGSVSTRSYSRIQGHPVCALHPMFSTCSTCFTPIYQ